MIELQGITKSFGTLQVLKGIDLMIEKGEVVSIVGPSGAGKTTLLQIMGTLDKADTGTILLNGTEVSCLKEKELSAFRNRQIGFVFQFYNLISSLSALENVQLVTEIADNPMPAEEALRLVDLGHRLNHFPAQLSGGEQQRVAIARAVAKRPELLLCDEPTGALDFQTGKLVLDVIEKVNREIGTTTLVITHNASIAGMADRVVRLRSGEISEERRNLTRLSPSELVW